MMIANQPLRRRRRRCSAITMVEVLIAATILTVVTATTIKLYIFPFRVWKNNSALWALTIQGKLVRERLISGSTDLGISGLRAARFSSITKTSKNGMSQLNYALDMNATPTVDVYSDDTTCNISYEPGNGVVEQISPGPTLATALSKRVKTVGSMTYTINNTNNSVTATINLQAMGSMGRLFSYPVVTTVSVANP